jgi:membrane-associated protease RseP (regulator of RpoE activity)
MMTFIASMALEHLRPRGCPRARHCLVAVAWLCAAVFSAAAVNGADEQSPTAFTPADISIGEPIALPVAPPTQPAAQAADAEPATRTASAAVPGSGWLGVTVAESAVPGRWRIDDVVAGGPAARAGIAVGDELRAVNGISLQSLEEASQAVTSIAAGQEVRIAVARADAVHDLALVAEPRPVSPAGRGWQGAEAGGATHAAAVQQPAPRPAAPAVSAQPPAADVLLPPLPAPGAAAFAAAPQTFGAAGTVTPTVPGPAAFAPAVPPPTPQPAPRSDSVAAGRGRTALGVRTLPIDPGIQARFNLPDASGAYVIGVVQDLPASKAGVPPGSVIVALDNRPVRSPIELTQLVTSGPVDRPVTVQYVLPGGEAKRADVVLQALETPLERVLIGSTPTGVTAPPALRTAERPLASESTGRTVDTRPLIDEIRFLRTRLERLERRLQSLVPSR